MLVSYSDINLDFRKNENNEIIVSGNVYDKEIKDECIKNIGLITYYDLVDDCDNFIYCSIIFTSCHSIGVDYTKISDDILSLFRENISNFIKLEIDILMDTKMFPDRLEKLLNRLPDEDKLELTINNL